MSNSQPVTMAEIMDQLRLLSKQETVEGVLMVDDDSSDQPEQLSIDKTLTEEAEDPEFTIVENVTEVIDPSYARSNITNDIPETSEASEGTESIALDLGSISETEERDTGDDDDALIKSEEAQKMWDALKAMENADSDSTIQNIRNILNSPPVQPPEIVSLAEEANDAVKEEEIAIEIMPESGNIDLVSNEDDLIELDLGSQDDMIEVDMEEANLIEDAQDEPMVDAKNVHDEIAGYLKQLEEINQAEPSEEYSQQQELADISMLSNSSPEKRQLWKDLSSMMAFSSSTLAEEDEDEEAEDEDEEQEDEEEENEEEEDEKQEEKKKEKEEENEEEEDIDVEDEMDNQPEPQIQEEEEQMAIPELQVVEEVGIAAPESEPQITIEEILASSQPLAMPSDFYVERMTEHMSRSQPDSLKEEDDDEDDPMELDDINPEEEEIALDNLIDNISTKDLYEDANDFEELVATPEIQVPLVSNIFIRKPLPQIDLTPMVYSQPLPQAAPIPSTQSQSITPKESLIEKVTNLSGFNIPIPTQVPLEIYNKDRAIDVYPYEMGMFKTIINDALKKRQTTLSRLAKRFNTTLGKTMFQPTDLQGMFDTLGQLTPRQFKQLQRLEIYKDLSTTSTSVSKTSSNQLNSNLTYVPSRFQPSHSLFRSARQPSLFGKK